MNVRHHDTIIVGAGAAGSVIAARMTEDSSHDVLLLEAGPDYPNPNATPPDLENGKQNSLTAHDWGFRHKPNSRQLTFPLPRGRVVGGSSAVNTCIGLRGVPSDYDEWAAMGLPEWSWEKCLPAFKRLENDLDIRNEWHNQGGPIPLRRHTAGELVPWQAAFLSACERQGYSACPDHNAPDARGFGPHAMNKIDGRRMGAALCYLTPEVRARPGLSILPHTHVVRTLIENGACVGVEVERHGRRERIGANRVVLCGGAIATPGILLRSGVGSKSRVESMGVELLVNLDGVGARLLDHPGSAIFLMPKKGVCELDHPLIQTALRTRSKNGLHENDIQIQAGSVVHLPRFSVPLVSLMVQVGKPNGHGVLHWKSADPHERPHIESRLLDDDTDRAVALEALEIAIQCAATPDMRQLATPVWPPPPVFRRRVWLDRVIRTVSDSGYHPCGTTPMGRDDDPYAVTDQHGRVRGVQGLYVADASLMPTIPTANTHLPTLMIGERFGEWLRQRAI